MFLFAVAIPVNYTNEFREISEATTYLDRNSLSSAWKIQQRYGMLYVLVGVNLFSINFWSITLCIEKSFSNPGSGKLPFSIHFWSITLCTEKSFSNPGRGKLPFSIHFWSITLCIEKSFSNPGRGKLSFSPNRLDLSLWINIHPLSEMASSHA